MEAQDTADGVAADQLLSIVERIEQQEAEKADITEGIKEIYSEAKSSGFDTAAIRQVIRIRKQDRVERQEAEAILDTYLSALGMS